MFKKWYFVVSVILVLAFALAACAKPTEAPVVPEAPVATEAPAGTEAPVGTEAPAVPAQSDIILNVTPAGASSTTFTYNFNPFSTTYLFPTWAGIYEPLMINNRIKGEIVP